MSPELLDTLISVFQVLPGSNPTQSQNEENTQTFIALRPVLDNVLSPETVFEWENGEHTADERPTSLVQRLDRLRQGLNQFMPGQDLYQNGPETSEADTSVSHGSST
ncbi:hypothetical protein FRC01_008236 [Tulasnella sp. 417]|nr:hypothetical protein FRC01_008236 [Tulasnella sp. 417]